MCGITGIFAFNLVGKFNRIHVTQATMCLDKRGPDHQDIYTDDWIGLGHRRLSIIDTSTVSNQPMWDETGRYCIVFNGEIFNYRELREDLEKTFSFKSNGDTEVLLKLYIRDGEKCLSRLNGFFAFCIYDKVAQTMFVARDRYGIKPLLYTFDEDKFIFASEMKSVLQYGIDKAIDYNALYTYLQLNYIPAPLTIFKSVKKLLPGHCLFVSRQKIEEKEWYSIPYDRARVSSLKYDEAKKELSRLLELSVQRRLVADVPLGAFLSGGIDSSVVTGIASRYKSDLHTFSIGYRDEKFFDETSYANLVAKHFGTKHTVFLLTNDDLYESASTILKYIDEPFADSSAIAVYLLSRETRKFATVALSGDGADELLAGYNKHEAFQRVLNPGLKENLVSKFHDVWKAMPKSRSNPFGNRMRQLYRFSEGSRLSSQDRYWRWASFVPENDALRLLTSECREAIDDGYNNHRNLWLKDVPEKENINEILLTDTKLVLPNDMLTKVDLMSMAASIEVRVPFLDYEFVNFVFSLPVEYKIGGGLRKRILQDAYRDVLPAQLYNRPKKGFEVPLLKWFRREMKSLIVDDLLSEDLIKQQGIFDYQEIGRVKTKLFSANPEDTHATVWALIVFQSWWKRYFNS